MAKSDVGKTISKNLYSLMAIHNISRTELASKLGVSVSSVGFWATGQKIPRMDKVDKMCEIFGCRRSDILEEPASDSTSIVPHPITMPVELTSAEQDMITDYRTLNDIGQQEASKRVHELTLIPSYVADRFSGHLEAYNDNIPMAAHHKPGFNGSEQDAADEALRLRRKYSDKD